MYNPHVRSSPPVNCMPNHSPNTVIGATQQAPLPSLTSFRPYSMMLSSLAWYTSAAEGESKINFSTGAAEASSPLPTPELPPPPPRACQGISESLSVSRSPSRRVSVVFATTNLGNVRFASFLTFLLFVAVIGRRKEERGAPGQAWKNPTTWTGV